MDENEIRERISAGRAFITNFSQVVDDSYQTDQQLKKPQPPLAKAPMAETALDLPKDFSGVEIERDFLHIVNSRKSHRVYTEGTITLEQLSFLLWCTQGVKSVRGRSYATLRTVPGGGARHPFECYMAVRKVEGLQAGLYHYLPMTHRIEYLGMPDDLEGMIGESLSGQSWAEKASVVFYYSCVFYRAEWRYGVWAHPTVLIDSGHITENLYLAATAIGLGGCAIAAVDTPAADRAFGLDGVDESIFYAMPVGTVAAENHGAEDAFYAFVREEGL
ncbi:MAG: SagB/ThcOx family dehydrogenase [Clostridia bacterium]|nr:SagB/ThcOx family dehydrogenase [Clostridia bacterium]